MLTYSLTERTNQTLYVYFYECIRRDILSGVLRADEKLPSKRALAYHHQVSLVTIEAAYRQLIAEGYVRAHERRGYYVNAVSPVVNSALVGSPVPASDSVSVSDVVSSNAFNVDASYGNRDYDGIVHEKELTHHVAYQQFPYALWAKNIRKTLTEEPLENLFEQSDARGMRQLRVALARYLGGSRGIQVDPDCIVIGAGAQVLYLLVVQLLGMGNRIALENPGYTKLAEIYQSLGMATDLISTDKDGMLIDDLTTSQATVAHIMPSHQYPTGSVMSVARRYELLSWAAQKSYRYIIEDDYDAELRFSGIPIPTLSSIDVSEKVLYINTFTKTLGSAFRIGYMILPPHLMERFLSKLGFYSCSVSTLDQLSLARFIESGEYERHNNRLKVYYKNIARLLVEVVNHCDQTRQAHLCQIAAGTHCLLQIPKECALHNYAALFQTLEDAQVRCMPLSAFYQGSHQDRQRWEKQLNEANSEVFVIDYAYADSAVLADSI